MIGPPIPWTRSRRLVWWGSLVAVVVGVVGLGVGYLRLLNVGWKFGAIEEPRSAVPVAGDPEADQWVFRARRVSVMTYGGQLQLASSEYRAPDATREGLERWSTWGGWDVVSFPAASITSRTELGSFFRGVADWRVDAGVVGAVGIYENGRGGEEVRVGEAPFWPLVLMAAVPGVVVWRRARRLAGRQRRGECVRCGYPLPAGVASCPECGAPRAETPAPKPAA